MTHRLTLPSICRSVTYILWSSDFASYLEDYLMEKRCTWIMDQCDSKIDLVKYMWVSDLYFMVNGPLILPCIIVRLKLFLYIKK